MLGKTGVLVRGHKIPKSIRRYYTSENSDLRLKTKLDLWKSLKFSNRSGACLVAKAVIFMPSTVAGGTLHKQSLRSKSSRWLHYSGYAATGGRVREVNLPREPVDERIPP